MKTSREQHMQWCKDRACQILAEGDIKGAFASMVSDLNKHPGTAGHSANVLGMMLMMNGDLDSVEKMKKFIEGYN